MRGLAGLILVLRLCLFVLLGGCATQFADDVELRSGEAVYLPERGAPWSFEGWLPAPEARAGEDSNPQDADAVILKVTFVSSVNIPKFAKEKVDSLTIDGRFCDRPDEDLLMVARSEEHTSALQSLMRISYAVFCLKNKI